MKKHLIHRFVSTCLIIAFLVAGMEIRFYIIDMKKRNAEVLRQETEELNQELCSCLYIKEYGVEYKEDEIDIAYMTYSENKLIQDLSYYNHRNEDGATLTVEDVMTEYDNFCNNTGSYARLKDFCEYDVAGQHPRYRENLIYFYRKDYTGEKKAFDDTVYTGEFAELTAEEMWELCDAYFARNNE